MPIVAQKRRPITVLDIGCGWGQNIARLPQYTFYGVDIAGFPKEFALQKGYKQAREYGDSLTIPYDASSFDIALMVNLTAHVPDEVLSHLLGEAKRLLKPEGILLVAAECDNEGWSKKTMRRISRKRLQLLIQGMDHKNYKFEEQLDRFFASNGFDIKRKDTIMGHFLPFIHYWSFAFLNSPYKKLRYVSIAADIILSIVDNIATWITSPMRGKRFIIGYVCTISTRMQGASGI
jgi:ubiquinone/menaquinone biosynthesis C-methylase UbiE